MTLLSCLKVQVLILIIFAICLLKMWWFMLIKVIFIVFLTVSKMTYISSHQPNLEILKKLSMYGQMSTMLHSCVLL